MLPSAVGWRGTVIVLLKHTCTRMLALTHQRTAAHTESDCEAPRKHRRIGTLPDVGHEWIP